MFTLETVCAIICVFSVQYTIGEEECNPGGIMSCVNWLIPGDFEMACSTLNGPDCHHSKFTACEGASYTQYKHNDARKMLGSICTFHSTLKPEYDKYKNCYINISADYDKCNERFQEVMSRPATQEKAVAQKCCAMKQTLGCAISVTAEKCEANATLYPKEVVRIAMETIFKPKECNKYREGSKHCKPYDFFKSSANTLTFSLGLLGITTILCTYKLN